MKSPKELVSELYFSDPNTHWFAECLQVKKPLDIKVLGVYKQRLDACDMKMRFSAKAFLAIQSVIKKLEHGEFIYFDDAGRLEVNFNVESMIIFLRAALDLAVSAYSAYFSSKTNIDSFNDFIKRIGKGQIEKPEWLPVQSQAFWLGVYEDYESEEYYTWVCLLVGRDKGMSLRDLVIHKQNVTVDTYIDEDDKGRFYIGLSKDSMGHILPWLEHIFDSVQRTIERVKNDILNAEKQYA